MIRHTCTLLIIVSLWQIKLSPPSTPDRQCRKLRITYIGGKILIGTEVNFFNVKPPYFAPQLIQLKDTVLANIKDFSSLQGPVNVNHSVGTVRRVLSEALNVWAKNSKLTFREVSGDDADLLVSFVR